MLLIKKVISPRSLRYVYRDFARFAKRDPGIQHRKTLLAEPSSEEFVDFEELETDFMDAHKSHKQHLQELESQKEREKYLIVRQKYFKEKLPSFLTWHDKEQIRHLHRTDPEEWTVERLSEGFPALPHVIKKIAKSNWTKSKQHKITNHDAVVQRNWHLFKAGKMPDLPEDLVEHLNKFTNRSLNLKPFVIPQNKENVVQVKNNKIGTEFSEIITSYERLKKGNADSDEKQIDIDVPKLQSGDTYLATPVNRKKQVTFNQLHLEAKERAESGKEETSIVGSQNRTLEENNAARTIDLPRDKYETSSGIEYFKKTERDLSHLTYPKRITIPKKLHKKGLLYKLNDCYYDDDGEFLYRVPGMT